MASWHFDRIGDELPPRAARAINRAFGLLESVADCVQNPAAPLACNDWHMWINARLDQFIGPGDSIPIGDPAWSAPWTITFQGGSGPSATSTVNFGPYLNVNIIGSSPWNFGSIPVYFGGPHNHNLFIEFWADLRQRWGEIICSGWQQVAVPDAPILTPTGSGGTIAPGDYDIALSYETWSYAEGLQGALSTVTVSAGQVILVTSPGTALATTLGASLVDKYSVYMRLNGTSTYYRQAKDVAIGVDTTISAFDTTSSLATQPQTALSIVSKDTYATLVPPTIVTRPQYPGLYCDLMVAITETWPTFYFPYRSVYDNSFAPSPTESNYVPFIPSPEMFPATAAVAFGDTKPTKSGSQTVDGVSVIPNDYVFIGVSPGTGDSDNGLWRVTAGTWIRPVYWDDRIAGMTVTVGGGDTYKGKKFVLTDVGSNDWTPLTYAHIKGDIVVSTGAGDTALPVGTDTYLLNADSSQSTGVKYTTTPTVTTLTIPSSGSPPSNPPAGSITLYQTATALLAINSSGSSVSIGGPTYSNSLVWTKYTKTFSDFSFAGTSKTLTIASPGPGGAVVAVKAKPSVKFAGGAISSYTVSVGLTGVPNTIMPPYEVGPPITVGPDELVLDFFADASRVRTQVATPDITVTATSTGANLSAATQGSIDIWILFTQPT